jgi:hypothetical protein
MGIGRSLKFFDPVGWPVQVPPLSLWGMPARPTIMTPRKSSAGTPGAFHGGVTLRWSLVISFFVHKIQR